MRTFARILPLALMSLLIVSPVQAGVLDEGLQNSLADLEPGGSVTAIVILEDQVDLVALQQDFESSKLSLGERHRIVVEALQSMAADTQSGLRDELSSRKQQGVVIGFRANWLVNSFTVKASGAQLRQLAAREDVTRVELAPIFEPLELPQKPRAVEARESSKLATVSDGLVALEADRVWNELGIDGSGTIVGTIDTGGALWHEALSNNWQGNFAPTEEAWYDVVGAGLPMPEDLHYQGTAILSMMCGSSSEYITGVAPGANWIAADLLLRATGPEFDAGMIAALEFMADPDGDPTTFTDVPAAVCIAWGISAGYSGYDACDSRWWNAIDACEAAGVALIFAAGDNGTDPDAVLAPANRATTPWSSFSVGSNVTSLPNRVSTFSSRGPSACGGPYATKPEVVAPGENLLFAYTANAYYAYFTSTIGASAYVAGTVALMRAANPELDVNSIKQILMDTAADISSVGDDNNSGHGRISAYEAVLAAMNGRGILSGTVTDASNGAPLSGARMWLDPSGAECFTNALGDYALSPTAGSYTLHVEMAGYEAVMPTVDAVADSTVQVDIVLVRSPWARVHGTVLDPSGLPMAGATVRALNTGFPVAITAPDGSYELFLAPGSDYIVHASADPHQPDQGAIDLAGETALDLQLHVQVTEDFETGNFVSFLWTWEGAAPWVIDDTTCYDGAFSARSGDIVDGQYTGLALDLEVLAESDLNFVFKVSSQEEHDTFGVIVDGVLRSSWIGGEVDWTQRSITLSQGTHHVVFEYGKDSSISVGSDAVWVDFIRWPSTVVPVYPSAGADPGSYSVLLATDQQSSRAVTLDNSGEAALEYLSWIEIYDAVVPSEMPPDSLAGPTRGGPDAGGYFWFDSNDPGGPDYEWVEINAIGTALPPGANELSDPIDLGFAFTYYDSTYTEVYISTNGFVNFTGGLGTPSNTPLPDPNYTETMVCAFWDDLNTSTSGAIYHYQDTANDRFIVEWDAVPRFYYGSMGNPQTFQLILHADGSILFQYKDIPDPNSVTVGMEDWTGLRGTLIVYNQPYLENGLAIRLWVEQPWLKVDTASGSVPVGDSLNLGLDIDSAGRIAGSYGASLMIQTNDPLNAMIEVPFTLVVAEGTDAETPDLGVTRSWLGQAHPNPFNPSTRIRFGVPSGGRELSLKVYDLAGRRVATLATGFWPAGDHHVTWNARDEAGHGVASGVYLYRLETSDFTETHRMVLIK